MVLILMLAFIAFCIFMAVKMTKRKNERKPADQSTGQGTTRTIPDSVLMNSPIIPYAPGRDLRNAPPNTVVMAPKESRYAGWIKQHTWFAFNEQGIIDTCCVCHKYVHKDDRFYVRCVDCKKVACKDCHYLCPYCFVARCDDCVRLGGLHGNDIMCPNVSWHGPMQREL
ncbi:hypothetical protein CS006_09075 [Bifidobacterium primatium]|uniref:Uncharacterized protein n=2 Tax=Bifidobacterium TaxID=1678 RepID=A0A2M9H7B8_9BIFI|nr:MULTISPECIES: hypothetical protein [Bifidobacterium]NEG95673.1 hypothetical protein [Bifidobacterium sp. SMB2]NEH11100.1 hypothetical protein [Bifidobacterium saimiriisciurei]PJM72702.1 hypothetical protein CS006_09075 [Bifidobacterium primatium]